jgi:hypothetical protein
MSKQKSASGKGAPVNVLYVATMHNSVYAFDADSPGSQPIWKVTLAPSVESGRAGVCPETYYTSPELGILSTPVIDAASGILYAVYATPTGDSTYGHYLAALDIRTGEPRAGSPVQISASVAGDGMESQGGTVPLTGKTYIQRPALTLANGTVFTAFGSCGPDPYPYHGWVIGYKASDVKVQTSVYNSTPNGFAGAFWQSGRGLVADHLGNIYGSTGNGTNSPTDASESVVKLDPAGKLAGVFTDPNFARLNETDLDLRSELCPTERNGPRPEFQRPALHR